MTYRRWSIGTILIWGALSVFAGAQGTHQHPSADGEPPTTEAHHRVDGILREAEAVMASGRGFGMAFAADQHGYPGPMHAVELREPLALTPDQVAALETLTASMFAAARPRSRDLLDAEERLRRVFASGAATEVDVEPLVREIERTRADVRLIHLRAHLQAFDVLTAHQRQRYGQIRWGAR